MLDHLKSIKFILQERITSPLSGALFLSWFVWNWKLLFTLLFPDSSFSLSDRIAVVQFHYLNVNNNLLYPILSALFLILIYPFATTGALWVTLWFRRLQRDLRNKIEQTQLLSLEQSIALRLNVKNQQERFDRLLKDKDDEIALLRSQIKNEPTQPPSSTPQSPHHPEWDGEFNDFISKQNLANLFSQFLIERIPRGLPIAREEVSTHLMAYFISHDIVTRHPNSAELFEFTEKGKYFARRYTDSYS